MPKKIPSRLKQEAIRLRVQERLSQREIVRRTGLSVGTVSALLRPYPLTETERRTRQADRNRRWNPMRRYDPTRSKFAETVAGEELSRERKGRIAEAAVLFRLALMGFDVWHPQFDCHRIDWLVSRPGVNKYVRLQVRWAGRWKHGRPLFMINKTNREPLDANACDFFVGYDLETDTAFVIPMSECVDGWRRTCAPEYAEAWHLLGI